MERSNYLLKVEKPCQESWAGMLPTNSGRFCVACAKNVTDFTKLSDDQVLAILNKSGENSCGRFGQSQMNRYLIGKSEPSGKSRIYKFFAGVFLLITANQAVAKTETVRGVKVEQHRKSNSGSRGYRTIRPKQNPADTLDTVFKGSVVYALNHRPIPGVSITLEGHEIKTTTNEEGKFEMVFPSGLLKETNTFIASFIGFETKAIEVNINDFSIEKNITLSRDPALDEVVFVGSYAVHKHKWWQFRRKKYCK